LLSGLNTGDSNYNTRDRSEEFSTKLAVRKLGIFKLPKKTVFCRMQVTGKRTASTHESRLGFSTRLGWRDRAMLERQRAPQFAGYVAQRLAVRLKNRDIFVLHTTIVFNRFCSVSHVQRRARAGNGEKGGVAGSRPKRGDRGASPIFRVTVWRQRLLFPAAKVRRAIIFVYGRRLRTPRHTRFSRRIYIYIYIVNFTKRAGRPGLAACSLFGDDDDDDGLSASSRPARVGADCPENIRPRQSSPIFSSLQYYHEKPFAPLLAAKRDTTRFTKTVRFDIRTHCRVCGRYACNTFEKFEMFCAISARARSVVLEPDGPRELDFKTSSLKNISTDPTRIYRSLRTVFFFPPNPDHTLCTV